MDKGTLRPLTLHVPYNGCEYCRSQLEAHSFSNKPVPTTDEDGMRFHVAPCKKAGGYRGQMGKHGPPEQGLLQA